MNFQEQMLGAPVAHAVQAEWRGANMLSKQMPPRRWLDLLLEPGPNEDQSISGKFWTMLMALGGGTGAAIGMTGSISMERDLARRMRMQDEAVLLLLMVVYYVTLFFSGSLAYWQAKNRSPVNFYADPRSHTASAEGYDMEVFLRVFNEPPKSVYLRVSGFTPTYQNAPGSFFWNGCCYTVDFTFALDLSPWVSAESPASQLEHLSATYGRTGGGSGPPRVPVHGNYAIREDGVLAADAMELRRHLATGSRGNDMAIIEMQKEIRWANWEELATNIKHQIRQRGFDGFVGIDRTEFQDMDIYKNTQWANFMHSRTLKIVLALSIVGWFIYMPYMWFRCTKLRLRSVHRVRIAIDDYWRLISDQLTAQGFRAPQDAEDDPAAAGGGAAAPGAGAPARASAFGEQGAAGGLGALGHGLYWMGSDEDRDSNEDTGSDGTVLPDVSAMD